MALSEESKQRAKDKAKSYLENSIYTLAILLSLDPDNLDDSYENPLGASAEGTELWNSHEALKMQIEAYSKLV